MKCEPCLGKGFTELDHGLVMVPCKVCDGTGEVKGSENQFEDIQRRIYGNSSSGTERDNQPVRSKNTSKPKRTGKSKAKKKTRARSR